MKKESKRYKNLTESLKKKYLKTADQVIKEVKNGSGVKFVESVDLSLKINIKKIKGADTGIRTLIDLPHGNGKKLKVAVVFGGRSGEHEVSLVSASSVIKALDPEKYNVFEIGITREGQWLSGPNCLDNFKKGNYADLSPVNFDM